MFAGAIAAPILRYAILNSNVNKSIAIGAAWMIGLRQLDRVIGLISTTILARLLLPADFGLVVYAMTFIAIVELFFEFGFETVLIRDQEAGPETVQHGVDAGNY